MTTVPAVHDPAMWPSTKFIQSHTDDELLIAMGVHSSLRAGALRYTDPFPEPVQFWLDHLADIYRPSVERQLAGPPNLSGRSLVLWGPPGGGKTVMAIRVLLAAVRAGVHDEVPERLHVATRYNGWCQGYWMDWQEISDTLRRQAKGEDGDADQWAETEMLLHGGSTGGELSTRGGQFLVIDDVSRERSTIYNLDRMQHYLRYRQTRGIPTIITTNTPPVQWESTLSVSLGNFLSRSSIAVEIESRRGLVAAVPTSKRRSAPVVFQQ